MQPSRFSQAVAISAIPVAALSISGCAAIEGIFKAGVWVGVIAVAIVLAVVFGLVRAFSG